MTQLPAYLEPQLDRLSKRQRNYFDIALKGAGSNPFKAAQQLRTDMASTEFDVDLRFPANLVLMELRRRANKIPLESADPEQAAREDYEQQIRDAEVAGDTDQAAALRATLERVQARREADTARAEQVQQDHAKYLQQAALEQQEEMEKHFEKLKQARISELMFRGQMEMAEAEKLFEDQDRVPIEQSLRRQMGLD